MILLASVQALRAAVIVAIGVWLILAGLVAYYGAARGFRFWPLWIAAVFLGFPLVLLGVTLAAGPDREG